MDADDLDLQAFNDLMIRGQPPSATNGDIRPFGYMSNLNQRSKHTFILLVMLP